MYVKTKIIVLYAKPHLSLAQCRQPQIYLHEHRLAHPPCVHKESACTAQLLHAGQTSAYKTIMNYLQEYWFGRQGPLITAACCFAWCVCVLIELRAAVSQIRAAMHLWGPDTSLSLPDESGKRKITALSTSRIIFFVAVQALRIGIALVLLIGGLKFLVGTFNLSDLLLNTVAVAFVRPLPACPPTCPSIHLLAHPHACSAACVHTDACTKM